VLSPCTGGKSGRKDNARKKVFALSFIFNIISFLNIVLVGLEFGCFGTEYVWMQCKETSKQKSTTIAYPTIKTHL
jgi:hypothetical protein